MEWFIYTSTIFCARQTTFKTNLKVSFQSIRGANLNDSVSIQFGFILQHYAKHEVKNSLTMVRRKRVRSQKERHIDFTWNHSHQSSWRDVRKRQNNIMIFFVQCFDYLEFSYSTKNLRNHLIRIIVNGIQMFCDLRNVCSEIYFLSCARSIKPSHCEIVSQLIPIFRTFECVFERYSFGKRYNWNHIQNPMLHTFNSIDNIPSIFWKMVKYVRYDDIRQVIGMSFDGANNSDHFWHLVVLHVITVIFLDVEPNIQQILKRKNNWDLSIILQSFCLTNLPSSKRISSSIAHRVHKNTHRFNAKDQTFS